MGNSPICKIKKDLTNQVVVITGANTGIGRETARKLASLNATLILACRSIERTQPLLDELKEKHGNAKVEFIKLDLGDLDSVLEFSKVFKEKYDKIDILLNNAGVMMPNNRELTKQNFELQIGTNHFGHFVLTNQLLPLLKNTQQSRIINVSSLAHENMFGKKGEIHFDNLNFDKDYDPARAYAQSKLANVLFTKYLNQEMEKQKKEVKVVCLHPGVIATELSRYLYVDAGFIKRKAIDTLNFLAKTPQQGAQTNIYCCLEDYDKLEGGAYYSDLKTKIPSKTSQDQELIKKFQEFSNDKVAQYLQEW